MAGKSQFTGILTMNFLVGGYRLVYDRKCPFTLHVVAPELIEKVGHTI